MTVSRLTPQMGPPTEQQSLLAKKVLHRIETEPGTHDQTVWVERPDDNVEFGDLDELWESMQLHSFAEFECGTTACVAGWAAIEHLKDTGGDFLGWDTVEELAEEVLGLSPVAAWTMFDGNAKVEDVTRWLGELADGRVPSMEDCGS